MSPPGTPLRPLAQQFLSPPGPWDLALGLLGILNLLTDSHCLETNLSLYLPVFYSNNRVDVGASLVVSTGLLRSLAVVLASLVADHVTMGTQSQSHGDQASRNPLHLAERNKPKMKRSAVTSFPGISIVLDSAKGGSFALSFFSGPTA
jgi:hypothetical protein